MKADQERVKNLLIDTVTLLCKNSLSYEDELCIEGLLGVKIDHKDVFFVHISQTFQNALTVPENEQQVTQSESNTVTSERIRVKRETSSIDHPLLKDEGIEYSPYQDPSSIGARRADLVAGQRRLSHSQNRTQNSGNSPRGGATNNSLRRSRANELLSNNHNNDPNNGLLFGEPPHKRHMSGLKEESLENDTDNVSGLGADCQGDVASPWPNIGGHGNMALSAAQVNNTTLRDFEPNPSSDQPSCSTWPFPAGILPQGASDMGPVIAGVASTRGFPDVAKIVAINPDSILPYHSRRPSAANHVTGSGSKKPKKYTCGDCEKAFVSQTDLDRHRRTHTGERPFKCEVCGAAFALESNLKKHARVHTQEKPYDCRICGRVFGYTNTLIQHLRTVHNLKDV